LARLPWPARLYITAVVLIAVGLVARGPFGQVRWLDVVILGLLLFISESTATRLRSGNLSWSANTTAMLAAAVLVGPVGAALVGACTAFGLRRGLSFAQRSFNTGMWALTGYVSGWVFLTLYGHVGVPDQSSFPKIIAPFAVAAIVHVLVNHALLSIVLWLTRTSGDGSVRKTYSGLNVRLFLSDLGYDAFGLLIAALWRELGPFTPVLVLIPLFIARWAVAQFAAQQRAYEATVSALCQAVETK